MENSPANVLASFLEEQKAFNEKVHKEQQELIQRQIDLIKKLSGGTPVETTIEPDAAKKKKVKKDVDPFRPKRPISGYQIFMAENNGALKAANPTVAASELMTLQAAEWGKIDPSLKAEYQRKGEVLKSEYLIQVAAYDAALGAGMSPEEAATAAASVKTSASSTATSSTETPVKRKPDGEARTGDTVEKDKKKKKKSKKQAE